MEGIEDTVARDLARLNIAGLKQDSGDVTGAIEELREVLS